MTSIKIKFRPASYSDMEGTLYFQISHDRRSRQIRSDYHVYAHEWDADRQTLKPIGHSSRRAQLLELREALRRDIERLHRIARRMDDRGYAFTADELCDEFERYKIEFTLFRFMETLIAGFRLHDRIGTSNTYRYALNSFRKFRNGKDIMLDCLTSDVLEAYEAWHRSRGNIPNTVSFYMRILRAVYHRAVEEGVIEDTNPFRRVYTGVDKTRKRALPLHAVRKIKDLELSKSPALDYARDMFLMSFYLRGMSVVDMAFLRKTDLVDGSVVYHRRKTGQRLSILWTAEMQAILDKYPENASIYLLPIIKRVGGNERACYRNAAYSINRGLKTIAAMIGLDDRLTMYVARHSWATAAKSMGIPLSVISEGMGHESEATTRIYLASLDTSVVDRANDLILSSL